MGRGMNAGIMPVISRQTVWLRGFAQKKFRCLMADFFVFAKTKASALGIVLASSHE